MLMSGVLLLTGCKDFLIEDPVKSCVIHSKIGAECGMRDMNYKHRSVGDFIGETKLEKISACDNCVCLDGKRWSEEIKPKLKEVNTRYRQRRRKR